MKFSELRSLDRINCNVKILPLLSQNYPVLTRQIYELRKQAYNEIASDNSAFLPNN